MSNVLIESGETLVVDLPCTACRYNLRSLSIDGRCPECGRVVAQSVFDFISQDRGEWRRRLVRDTAGLRSAREGISLLLIATALWVVVALLPDWWFVRYSTQRAIVLGIACAAWT